MCLLVRRASDTASRCLSGFDDPSSTLDLVLNTCDQLRAASLDESSAYLVALVGRAATKLQDQLNLAEDRPPGLQDADASEIVLLKGLWELELCLSRLSAAGHTVAST